MLQPRASPASLWAFSLRFLGIQKAECIHGAHHSSLAVSFRWNSFHPRTPPIPVIPISGIRMAPLRYSFSRGDRFLFSSSDSDLAHALAVQGRDILDGPPRCGRVHEGDGLVCRGSAAGSGADLACCAFRQAAVGQQSPQRSVVVPPCTLAQTHAELKEHDLVRVVTHPQVPHSHLTPLQVAVAAALALPLILAFLLLFLLLFLFLARALGLSIRGI